ncbi:hypothetical protein GCM10011571_00560 [Marinithermofilum abyssi]|jgi:hypothetical protein|uniref:Uncharacterized protein n=1 Tax=Marinithermofilum abyssi TaxID=1571185 RepID=A0A8J2VBF9_9BACL|nr:hypothetical protein [Marinithermofilum abyssi]GGE03601.1 hypothetical protein GCM10011571_00560 [Marinithermofilum abyssi]
MAERYVPQVTAASIPEDGGWVELSGENVLILSIPEWKEVVEKSAKGYRYVWMYDREGDAYIFCFRLADGTERAVAFAKEHAGVMLQDGRAFDTFAFLITTEELNEVKEDTPMLLLQKVRLKRHPQAGW